MSHPKMSYKKTNVLCFILFLVGIAVITITKAWWPGVMLAIGIPLALRQYLYGRTYDMSITLFVFIGIFTTVQFDIAWEIILPVLFTLGGFYIFFREFFGPKDTTESEDEESLNKEIEEEEEDQK